MQMSVFTTRRSSLSRGTDESAHVRFILAISGMAGEYKNTRRSPRLFHERR